MARRKSYSGLDRILTMAPSPNLSKQAANVAIHRSLLGAVRHAKSEEERKVAAKALVDFKRKEEKFHKNRGEYRRKAKAPKVRTIAELDALLPRMK